MNWLGKLVGGAAGLVLGGPVGAALGVLAGHLLDDKLTRDAENSKPRPPPRPPMNSMIRIARFPFRPMAKEMNDGSREEERHVRYGGW